MISLVSQPNSMWNFIAKIFSGGLKTMRDNSKIMMIGVLIFLFPTIFFFVTQSFIGTATDNVNTVQKQKLNILHTSVESLIKQGANEKYIQAFINEIVQQSLDVKDIIISVKEDDTYTVVNSTNSEIINTELVNTAVYQLLPIKQNESIIHNTSDNGSRIWKSYREVQHDQQIFYLYTLQDFSVVDEVMNSRIREAYLGLSLVFIFLIGLAYWLNQQIFWQKKYQQKVSEIKERDMFSNMIAHEFRTPLTAIKGYASFLKESDSVTGENSRFVDNISKSTERLIYLVNDFLEVARLQSGRVSLKKETIKVSESVDRVRQDLSPIIAKKNLSLITDIPTNLEMVTDSGKLQQILINLINNSIKYTDSGKITIKAEKEHDEVIFTIEDTGVGISGEDQKKLFQPFSRVGGADESNVVGTGLGMWITIQLLKLLDGEINLESIKGVGTRLIVSFKEQ